MHFIPDFSCQNLKGVGPKNALKLEKLGIKTAADLLFHLPSRYEDRTSLTLLGRLSPNSSANAVVLGKVVQVRIIKRPAPQLYCLIDDGSGQLFLRFIHYSRAQYQRFAIGQRVFAIGEVRYSSLGLEMIHPEYRLLSATDLPPLMNTLTPIYPSTEGLSQHSWMQLTDQALALLQENHGLIDDLIAASIVTDLGLPSLSSSLQFLHRPPKDTSLHLLNEGQHPAQRRLIVEELLVHRLVMVKRRDDYTEQSALRCPHPQAMLDQFFTRLPFTLTKAQSRVAQEICDDLQQSYPMMRLLQGDVGSGKTVIAAISALTVIASNAQVAFMAPTELLAEQHYRVVKQWFEPLQIRVSLLTGGLSKRQRDVLLSELADGQIDLLVGTHALFQEDVYFKRLALMIIDEQHRFGVHQRLALKAKGIVNGYVPHQLMMTATPIPRTLAMSVYADLACSVIDELPAGRKPITTLALDNHKRDAVIERIVNLCHQGQQVYWVCPLIEESEVLQCEAAEKSAQQLAQQLPLLTVGLLHGKMKSKDKEHIMRLFKDGCIHVLVATTVVEVGVDVPNASLMVIENSERLGLSQLHQLRGRVGRGSVSSYCILLYQSPLGAIARERIRVMRESQDGFVIAEKDLELRGSGELLGTRQTGETNFRLANLVRDRYLLPEVQKIADTLWKNHPDIARQMIARWLGGKENLIGV